MSPKRNPLLRDLLLFGAAILCSLPLRVRASELPTRPLLTLELAGRIADAAQAEAMARQATVVIAVVDEGGYPVLLRRLDDTQVASSQVAVDKARTAAIFRRPSKVFEDQVKNGRVSALALAGAVPLQGGLPIEYQGRVIGAIGVSGNSPQEDEDIARAGLAAQAARSPEVVQLEADSVRAAFAKGAPLHETADYKVHASRRDAPGLAEVHQYETDVIYVLEGRATFVTGGRIVDGKRTAPGEIRGSAIADGIERRLVPGAIVVVPRGTPHWFKAVEAPFLYYVVKPISGT